MTTRRLGRLGALPPAWLLALAAVLAAGALPRGAWVHAARADEAEEDGDEASDSDRGEAEQATRALDDEEARDLVDRLEKAARSREVADVVALLESCAGLTHPDLAKPLLKLTTHEAGDVAVLAAQRLLEQPVPEARDAAKLAKDVWKRGWSDRSNQRRWAVKGRLLRVVARLEDGPLDDRRFRDVLDLWRQVHSNPNRAYAPALVDVCLYVEATGDKRMARPLAESIDEPSATDTSSGTNPPASWWEERWYLWDGSRSAVAAALKALTGESFKSTEDARIWIKEQGRPQGFDW